MSNVETNCGAGASWCQSVWTSAPPLVDPVIINGMAIGFLVFLLYMLVKHFGIPKGQRDLPWSERVLAQWLFFFLGAGLAIGWLWP
jgi:hypothetical protein